MNPKARKLDAYIYFLQTHTLYKTGKHSSRASQNMVLTSKRNRWQKRNRIYKKNCKEHELHTESWLCALTN